MSRVMSKAPILLCCATKWESSPLIRRWALCEVNPLRYEGSVHSVDVVVLKTGIGAPNVREALACVAAPRLLLSTGFAGALQPGMASGDLALEVHGLDLSVPQAAREIAAAQNVPIHFGRMAHSDRILSDPKDKISLGGAGRCFAVDMESREIRVSAGRLGCPFLAARVILDSLDDSLPAEAPQGERLFDLLPYFLKNFSDMPKMARLGWLQRRAAARLAAFLEELLPRL